MKLKGRLLAAALVASCVRGGTTTDATRPPLAAEPARTAHVILVSVDGLRPDAIDVTRAPTLLWLRRQGAWATNARTIDPAITLPSHASMISGVEPRVHGITWNSFQPARGTIRVSTIFSVARDAGRHTALVAAKAKFMHLERPGSLTMHAWPETEVGVWPWGLVVNEAARVLHADTSVALLMVHLADGDAAGHTYGWMSPEYDAAVLHADSAIAEIIAQGNVAFGAGRWTLIVTADHGGHARTHGSTAPVDVRIPWIAWGEGVRPGRIASGVRTTDTAATILTLLGLPVPASWSGHVVRAALTPAASRAP